MSKVVSGFDMEHLTGGHFGGYHPNDEQRHGEMSGENGPPVGSKENPYQGEEVDVEAPQQGVQITSDTRGGRYRNNLTGQSMSYDEMMQEQHERGIPGSASMGMYKEGMTGKSVHTKPTYSPIAEESVESYGNPAGNESVSIGNTNSGTRRERVKFNEKPVANLVEHAGSAQDISDLNAVTGGNYTMKTGGTPPVTTPPKENYTPSQGHR